MQKPTVGSFVLGVMVGVLVGIIISLIPIEVPHSNPIPKVGITSEKIVLTNTRIIDTLYIYTQN